MMSDGLAATVPVSVVVPTIDRAEHVARCLQSLAVCRPRADEIVVVAQGRQIQVAEVVAPFVQVGARLVRCAGTGVGRALNLGLREAVSETVLVTHDDCTVAPNWVEAAYRLTAGSASTIVTGSVLPAGDPRAVPSTISDPVRRDYTGEIHRRVLFPNNMACPRSAVLALGGFDNRVLLAEDNDFCYRWLRGGYSLRYEPSMTVWHADWRTHEELERLHVGYWRGQGLMYAKHLRVGDTTMLRFLARDLVDGARGAASGVVRGRPRWSDSRRGVLAGLPRGLLDGWSVFGRSGHDAERGTGHGRT